MELVNINYEKDKDLTVDFETDEDFRFLYCKVMGQIKKGSNGNNSADYLFGKICQYYFQTNCYVLILDFSELQYEFGDRLRKTLNFFNEIGRDLEEKENPILIIKPKNKIGIDNLIEWIKPKNLTTIDTKEKAIEFSEKLFNELIK
ncbi:hypothetical protein [Psychroserpens sp. MEBiC05023]